MLLALVAHGAEFPDRVRSSAQADARLGRRVVAERARGDQRAQERAQKLMETHPSGVVGATLWAELQGLGVKVEASSSAQADAVATVGLIESRPNSRNVVPGSVFFTIDLRHLGKVLEVDATSRAARIEGGAFGPALESHIRAFVDGVQ